MTAIAPVIILLLSVLIISSLQLVPGTFSIFYHYALGKTTRKKADDRSLSFIIGAEIFVGVIWILMLMLLTLLSFVIDLCSAPFFWTLSGTLFAEAIAFLLFYFRRSRSTTLFISRRVAATLQARASKAGSRSDAIALGFFANLPELIFTFPLYLISAIIFLNSPSLPRILITGLFILGTILPLFIIRLLFRSGHNLAHITRFRAKLKPYLRLIIFFAYLVLAFAILNLGVTNYGR